MNLWWTGPLLTKVEVGCKESKRKGSWTFQLPSINHNHQRSRNMSEIHPSPCSSLLPPIPKDMWKPPGWPPPKPNPVKHISLKAQKEFTMLVKKFGGPENGLLVVGSALWPWGLGGTFSLCLQVVSRRNVVTIDNEHTQCSPGIFAIRITPAIQRNNFIFTNASLKQCDRIRISGTKNIPRSSPCTQGISVC